MHHYIRTFLFIVFLFSSTLFFGQGQDWYVIDLNGDTVSHIKADRLSQAGEDFIRIEKNGKFGLIDYAGRTVVKTQFAKVSGFSNGLACVKHEGRYGFIDTKGRMVVPARYEDASAFTDGVARVKLGGKYGFIDVDGKQVIDFKFAEVSIFSEGLAFTRKTWDKTFGMIDKSGEYFLQPTYQNLFFPKDGLIRARWNGKWGYLNLKGEPVIEPTYRYAFNFSNGVAWFSEDGMHHGLINKQGKTIVEPTYTSIKNKGFSEGLGAAVKDGNWGFINTKGEEVIPFEYDDVHPFLNGRAAVKKDGLWGFIDPKGEMLLSPRFKEASNFFPVRKRPVAVVLGANYKVPAPEPEVKEETEVKEVVEEAKPVVEETEKAPEKTTESKPTLGKTEAPKPTLGKENSGAADPMRLAKQLKMVQAKLSDSRLACTESLVSIKKAHEAGTLDVFSQEAPVAREKLNTAIQSYNEATKLLDSMSNITTAQEACPALVILVGDTQKKASTAGQFLQKASSDLDKAVSKDAYESFTTNIKSYFTGLEASSVSMKSLQSGLEDCLMGN